MELITIVVKDNIVMLEQGKKAKSRLAFTASGLEIYQSGSSSVIHSDCIPNLAMSACIDRHIPVISLRRAKWVSRTRG